MCFFGKRTFVYQQAVLSKYFRQILSAQYSPAKRVKNKKDGLTATDAENAEQPGV
jgi:hypothetical protein